MHLVRLLTTYVKGRHGFQMYDVLPDREILEI